MLGPVTYIVEIEDGRQHWKRHTDQLKDWLAPTISDNSRLQPETHNEQSEPFFPDGSDPPTNSDTTKPTADATEPAADPTDPVVEEIET